MHQHTLSLFVFWVILWEQKRCGTSVRSFSRLNRAEISAMCQKTKDSVFTKYSLFWCQVLGTKYGCSWLPEITAPRWLRGSAPGTNSGRSWQLGNIAARTPTAESCLGNSEPKPLDFAYSKQLDFAKAIRLCQSDQTLLKWIGFAKMVRPLAVSI